MNHSPLVQCDHISKTYHIGSNSIEALRDVSFTVSSGEFIALKGPSGSGKSTLLNICGMIDCPDTGEHLFEGEIIRDTKRRAMARRLRIGFVFQNFGLIPVMTAYENIEYPLFLAGMDAKQRKEAVCRIIDAVGIRDHQWRLPDRLSGGQKQRVAIARAIVKKPPLIIADEPTANLDTATAESVIELMKQLSGETGATFLIATHDERMSRHCQRMINLTDGRVS